MFFISLGLLTLDLPLSLVDRSPSAGDRERDDRREGVGTRLPLLLIKLKLPRRYFRTLYQVTGRVLSPLVRLHQLPALEDQSLVSAGIEN